MAAPIKNLLCGGLVWPPTEVRGTDVAELDYQTGGWPHPRRLILIRHRVAERPDAGGKKLIDVPGYVFQALVTSLGAQFFPPADRPARRAVAAPRRPRTPPPLWDSTWARWHARAPTPE